MSINSYQAWLKNRYMHIDFNVQSAIQSANNPVSKCQNGTLKFSIINILKIDG